MWDSFVSCAFTYNLKLNKKNLCIYNSKKTQNRNKEYPKKFTWAVFSAFTNRKRCKFSWFNENIELFSTRLGFCAFTLDDESKLSVERPLSEPLPSSRLRTNDTLFERIKKILRLSLRNCSNSLGFVATSCRTECGNRSQKRR